MNISFANNSPAATALDNPFESVGTSTPPKTSPSPSLASSDAMIVLRGNVPIHSPINTAGPQVVNDNFVITAVVNKIKKVVTELIHNALSGPTGSTGAPDVGDGGGEYPAS